MEGNPGSVEVGVYNPLPTELKLTDLVSKAPILHATVALAIIALRSVVGRCVMCIGYTRLPVSYSYQSL